MRRFVLSAVAALAIMLAVGGAVVAGTGGGSSVTRARLERSLPIELSNLTAGGSPRRGRSRRHRSAAAGPRTRPTRCSRAGRGGAGATWALGLLDLGLGRPADALERLDPLVSGRGLSHHTIALWAAPDLVESAARVGQPPAGRAALQRFSAWTQRTGAPWSLGVAQRSAALLAGGDVQRLTEAVAHHDDGRPLDRARTQLCLGEALRRSRLRKEARKELRAAVETFDRLGAGPWAERARSELRASGESVVRPVESLHERLTPQELRISRLAARGASNLEIAAQLFVSRKTVEYHLHKVFTKLGITGRLELVKLDLD